MTIAYFDCFSGVSGDMVLGALVDAGLDFDRLREELRKLPVDNFRIQRRYAKKHEIVATKIDVIIKAPDGRDVVEAPGADEPHHHHDHTHAADLKGRNLLISIGLNVLITLAQIIGGLISGSLALLSDAVHNLSDVISLIISYIAQRYSKKEASTHKTFGYKRAEIIAAFVNAATLIVIAVLLMKEAVERFLHPQAIASDLVIWLAVLGIVANGLSVLLLQKDSKGNMNMRSAYLHLLTDMMASVAVLVGGILMYFFKIYWIDSLLTLAISIYLIVMGYGLLKSSFNDLSWSLLSNSLG